MVKLSKQFLRTCQSKWVRILVLKCVWIAIMPDISQRSDQGQGYLSTLIWLWCSGYPRNNWQLKHQFLVQTLRQWITEWKHSEAYSTSSGWWEFWFVGLYSYMGTIRQLSTIISIRSLLYGERVIQFVIMQWGRALRWGIHWWLTFQKMIILWIWWQRFSQVRGDKTMLVTSFMISIINITRIETKYFLLASIITVTRDIRYRSKGLKSYGRKVWKNGLVYTEIDLNPSIGK